jgi:ribulose-bisphosphate carboxylase large chain
VTHGGSLGDWLSGERFAVTYLLSGDRGEAERKARDICFEETVELPEDLTPAGPIRDQIVGRLEELYPADHDSHRALISYAVETAACNVLQTLNVVFGNVSLKPGIRVLGLSLPRGNRLAFPGPRFGQQGLRNRLGVPRRPLICTALKPMGLSPAELAAQAFAFASGGIDLIKDDHGLSDQPFCRFEERVARCTEAVVRANHATGGRSVYVANLNLPRESLPGAAHRAKELGAGALLVCPGLAGLDTLRALAADASLGLPLIAHPSFLGSYVTAAGNGFSHGALFGQLVRLCGADVTVFPSYGGRFSFTRDECAQIAAACREELGGVPGIFPGPGGGMTTDRAADMRDVYGRDFVLLIGGGLHRHSSDLTRNARYFVEMIEAL